MKILVRATNWVGDAILCIPALRAIRSRFSSGKIVILARPWVAGLYESQDFADRVLPLESPGGLSDFRATETIARQLKAGAFDACVLFPNSFSSAWLAWRAGIPERIGYSHDARGFLLSGRINEPLAGEIPRHETYRYLELLRRAGWLDSLPVVEQINLTVASGARDTADLHLTSLGAPPGQPRIAFAAGAAFGSAKCWLPERFAAVADRLIEDFRATVILFGTSSERDITSAIAGQMKHAPIDLAGKTTITELPALLSACHLFVGNDSGAMHVAAAVGLPVVGIFGPTDPEGTAPVTPRATIVREPVFCSPCFLRRCPIDHRCMTRISTEAVYSAARKSWENC